MTLVMIGTLTFAVTSVLLFRRAIEEQHVRRRLSAVQDELRDLGYRNCALLRSEVFWTLDRSITAYCEMDTRVVLEVLRPVFTVDRQGRLEMDQRQQAIDEQLALPQHAEVAKLYDEAARLVMRHVLLRYLVLSMLTSATLVGLFGIWNCGRWVSRRILSDPLRSHMPAKPARAVGDGVAVSAGRSLYGG
jgi:hypothetical protein